MAGLSFNYNWELSEVSFETSTTGVSSFGASTPGCNGAVILGVSTPPQTGQASFAYTTVNAPPNDLGVQAFGSAPLAVPLFVLGAQAWISAPWIAFGNNSGNSGYAHFDLPIPAVPGLVGIQLISQSFWLDTCAPGGISSSNAVRAVVF
jgi:hypothetical protein